MISARNTLCVGNVNKTLKRITNKIISNGNHSARLLCKCCLI